MLYSCGRSRVTTAVCERRVWRRGRHVYFPEQPWPSASRLGAANNKSASEPFDQKVQLEKTTTWLTPKLVGKVKLAEWTNEGEMPAFLGLRTDKKAHGVAREQA